MEPRDAYSLAAKRMAGPVIAATATRVAAFSPLLFWPGIVGEFMKYLPLTLIATLSASLVVALFFTPTLGAMLGRAGQAQAEEQLARPRPLHAHRQAGAAPAAGDARPRRRCSSSASSRPTATFGNGVEFFPDIEPDFGLVQVRARGNLSIQEKDRLVAHGRGAAPRHAGDRDRLRPRRRGPARLAGGDRGHGRHRPVRVRRLAGAPQGERHPRRDPRQDAATSPASSSR